MASKSKGTRPLKRYITIEGKLVPAIEKIAKKEKRPFVRQSEILLEEALEARGENDESDKRK